MLCSTILSLLSKPNKVNSCQWLVKTEGVLKSAILSPKEYCYKPIGACTSTMTYIKHQSYMPHADDRAVCRLVQSHTRIKNMSYHIRVDIQFIFCLLYALYTCLVFRTFLCNCREWYLVFSTMAVQTEGMQAAR